jgi:hypothetical protein
VYAPGIQHVFFYPKYNKMKTTALFRIGIVPLLALLVFACKKEAQTSSTPSLLSSQGTVNKKPDPGPAMDWSVSIQVTKNACDEQVFTLTGLNKNGNAIGLNDGAIELTITDANAAMVGTPFTGTSPLSVTTHLAAGNYTLTAKVSTGVNLRGQSSIPIIVQACAACPWKGLDQLTCSDLPETMLIGTVSYSHVQLCQLLAYNRGNHGYGALVRLAQSVMVAKANHFTSQNPVVSAAEALIGNLDALSSTDQASVPDQYGAPEKGHVQDLVKCTE